jgi:membrane protease subunit HflK
MPNDPQWGKKDNEGPPDLDEMLRKARQTISALLGFRPRGPTPPPGGPNHYGAAMGGGLAVAILLVIAVWLASGFYIVDEGKRGVVLRFGKYLETTMPGARWHVPYPVEGVQVVDIASVRPVEVGYRGTPKNPQPKEALMLTDDENIVDVQFAVQYNIKNPEDYLFNNKDPDENVRQAAESSIREVVGKSKMDFVLSAGRTEVGADVKHLMQQILDRYKTGIQVLSVNMQNTQAPDPVLPAFEDVQRAKQDRERFKNEGQAYANDVVPRARGVAARLLEEANGYRQSMIANAQGDAARFKQILAEYERAPAVTRERMYLDAMQHILSSTSKVVVDTKGAGGQSLLYLPLDKLMQLSAAQSTTAPVTVPETTVRPAQQQDTTTSSSSASSDVTSRRDSLRSRDRETR